MEVKDHLGRVNESAPPRVPLCAYMRPPNWHAHRTYQLWLLSFLSPGPVRASVGTIRGLYSFVPGATVQPQPPFVYLQRIDDNMSSDLEWHLLRVRETIFNTLLQLTQL
jgi:hypothetical protein